MGDSKAYTKYGGGGDYGLSVMGMSNQAQVTGTIGGLNPNTTYTQKKGQPRRIALCRYRLLFFNIIKGDVKISLRLPHIEELLELVDKW